VQIYYSLATQADEVSLRIFNGAGQELSTLEASNQAGLHVARWNPRLVRATGEVVPMPTMLNENEEGFVSGDSDRQETQTQQRRGGQRGRRGAQAGGRGGQRGGGSPAVSAGIYYAVLIVDGETFRQPIRIENERPGN